jgi:hypothetical protein
MQTNLAIEEGTLGIQLLSRSVTMTPDGTNVAGHDVTSPHHEGQLPPAYAILRSDRTQAVESPEDTVHGPSEPL